jgi:hypothetical protein
VGAGEGAGAPAIHLFARDVRLEFYADVEADLESADGAAHRVRVRVHPPAGLQAPDEVEVDVPARGRVTAKVRLWRSSAPRGSRQALVVVAQALDAGAAVSTTASVDILPDPAWMPRLRRPLAVAALLLLAAAAGLEVRRSVRPWS